MTSSLFQQVKDWKTGLSADVVGVQDAIVSGLEQQTVTNTTTDDVLITTSSQSIAVDNTNSVSDSLSTQVLLPRISPLWMSRAPQDDVSTPVFNCNSTSTQTLGLIYLSPVRATLGRTYEALKVTMNASTMTNFYVALYSVNQSTGLATKIVDLGDKKSSINTSVQIQSFTLPAPITVNAGDVFFVAVLSVGGTAGSGYKSGLTQSPMITTPATYPTSVGLQVTATGQTSLPATIAYSALSAGVPTFYAALGYISSAPAPTNITLSDTFNRADGALGGLWVPRYSTGSGAIAVSTSQARLTGTAAAYSYATPTSTTEQQVDAYFSEMGGYSSAYAGTQFSYAMILRADANSCVVGRVVYGTAIVPNPGYSTGMNCYIQTFSNWTLGSALSGGTIRASNGPDFGGTQPGQSGGIGINTIPQWRFRAQGNTYTLYYNYSVQGGWVQALQWVDSGGLYTYTGKTAVGFAESIAHAAVDSWFGKDI